MLVQLILLVVATALLIQEVLKVVLVEPVVSYLS